MHLRTALPLVFLFTWGCAQVPQNGDAPLPERPPQSVTAPASPAPPAAKAEAAPPAAAEAAVIQPRLQAAAKLAAQAPEATPEPPVRSLWPRINAGFTLPPMDNELVREWESWYSSRPDYVERMINRSRHFLFHVVEQVEKRGMPMEIALLPMTESAYNPVAYSRSHASSMWQFIPSTGKDFGLRQNWWYDGRRDVIASTRAALDYLQKLHGMFGDWQLALAAYNWGEGSVQRAIARNQKAGLPTDYINLKMPAETQLYVPKLQAVKNIVARPQDFNLTLPQLSDHPYFVSVKIDRDIDVALAVQLAGMSLEEFQTLNPQMNKPVILAAGTPQILLPYDSANRFVRQLPQHRGPLATWTAWVAPSTMRTAEAAKAIGVPEAQLREI